VLSASGPSTIPAAGPFGFNSFRIMKSAVRQESQLASASSDALLTHNVKTEDGRHEVPAS
jgi:hypothetical protein